MKRALPLLLIVALQAPAFAWIDYGDKVQKAQPVFGKEFVGLSLKLFTENAEFEQEMPERVTVVLKNTTERRTLMPEGSETEGRHYALYIVVADKNGGSLFSRNIIGRGAQFVADGEIPPRKETRLLSIPFDALEVAKVEEYENGMPHFDPQKKMSTAGQLSPQLFVLKAVLLSGLEGKRPDFALASETWNILLLPKSVARMSPEEKEQKMAQFLKKMGEGAYGGIGVSSQLAAFGDDAVDPLIAMAEKSGGENAQAVRESRIWAIVTLCGTGSPRAEEYILKKIWDPVGFGDLSFLVWHSQGLRSKRIRAALREFALKVTTGQAMPWEKKHGPESRGHGRGCLEFLFKHFISVGEKVPDEVAAGCLSMGDPKIAAFALQVWKPSSPDKTIQVVKPLFSTPGVHPNLKKSAMHRLSAELASRGAPAYDRAGDVDAQWQACGMWLAGSGKLTPVETAEFLRCQVVSVTTPELKLDAMKQLRKHGGSSYPVRTAEPALATDWVPTWQWALKTGSFPPEQAVQFLCNQMRYPDEVDDTTRRALLIELKRWLGDEFPLKSTESVDTDADWVTCGTWLVQKGHFKPRRKKR